MKSLSPTKISSIVTFYVARRVSGSKKSKMNQLAKCLKEETAVPGLVSFIKYDKTLSMGGLMPGGQVQWAHRPVHGQADHIRANRVQYLSCQANQLWRKVAKLGGRMPGGNVQWHTGQYMARQTIFGQFSSQDTNVEHNSGMDESSVGEEVNEEAIYEE